MLSLVIGLLTLVLVLTSLLLILMILVQLPKKEAGLGMAFGGATADALFGAGSGTVLSQWTKYASGIFLFLALFLSVLRNHEHRASTRIIADELSRQPAVAVPASPAVPTGTTSPAPVLTLPLPTNVTTAATSAPVTQPVAVPVVTAPGATATPVDDVVPPAPAPAPQPTP